VRGHAVAPAELEDVLMSHPAVSDAAIIGVSHSYSGEAPRAYIVLKQHAENNGGLAKELDDFILERKPKYMRLSGGIEFVPEIPKSASGKILRRTLRDRYVANQKTKANL
jgi:4-coumarate--CoA ligase